MYPLIRHCLASGKIGGLEERQEWTRPRVHTRNSWKSDLFQENLRMLSNWYMQFRISGEKSRTLRPRRTCVLLAEARPTLISDFYLT
jgi:hypothetical protein